MKMNYLEELYRSFRPLFFSKALQIVRKPSVADDIVHDACLEILELNFEPHSLEHCKALMLNCIRRRALDYVRKAETRKMTYPKILPEVVDHPLNASSQGLPDEAFIKKVALVAELSEKERLLLTLFLEEHKVAEIAKQLDLEPKQVTNLKFRLMAKLRKSLALKALLA
jgi:RNA polymerase sigma factor (sigma-70 family)